MVPVFKGLLNEEPIDYLAPVIAGEVWYSKAC